MVGVAPVSRRNRSLKELEEAVLAALRSASLEELGAVYSETIDLERLLRKHGAALIAQNHVAALRLRVARALGGVISRTVVRGSHKRRLPPGMTKIFAFRCRKLARIPEADFESIIAAHLDTDEITMGSVLRWYYGDGRRRRDNTVNVRDYNYTVGELLTASPRLRPAFKGVPAQEVVLRIVVGREP
jgi:hypothetical protein